MPVKLEPHKWAGAGWVPETHRAGLRVQKAFLEALRWDRGALLPPSGEDMAT